MTERHYEVDSLDSTVHQPKLRMSWVTEFNDEPFVESFYDSDDPDNIMRGSE